MRKRGLRPGRLAAGFTLIEVLVVVAIAGILIAVASINLFPSDSQLARRQAGDVALAIEHARDAAWFGGRPTSITFTDGRVREWRYSGNAWEPDASRDHAIPEGVRVQRLFIDGAELPPVERLVFLPDGFGIPFRVAMEIRGGAWAVEGDPAGAVALVAQ